MPKSLVTGEDLLFTHRDVITLVLLTLVVGILLGVGATLGIIHFGQFEWNCVAEVTIQLARGLLNENIIPNLH